MQSARFHRALRFPSIVRAAHAIASLSAVSLRQTASRRLLSFMTALALLLSAGMPMSAVPAAAATGVYYVSPSGSDANPGTVDAPWRTVQKAASTAAAGDIVYVRAGTYNERVTCSKSGTSASRIVFQGYGTERPVVAQGFYLSGAYITIKQFEVSPGTQSTQGGAPRPVAVQVMGTYNIADDIRIHSLTQTIAQQAVWVQGYGEVRNCDLTGYVTWETSKYGSFSATVASNGTLRDCTIEAATKTKSVVVQGTGARIIGCDLIGPSQDMMVVINGKDVLIQDCRLYKVGRQVGASTHTEMIGFQADVYNPQTNITIDSCIFANPPTNTDWGTGALWEPAPFYIFFFGNAGYPAEPQFHYDEIKFTNNIFLSGVNRVADQNPSAGCMSDVYWYNNVFHGLGGPALDDTNVWRNNIFGKGFTIANAGTKETQDANYNLYWDDFHSSKPTLEGAQSVTGEPGFVSPVTSSATRYGLDADWHVTAAAMRRGIADSFSPVADKDGRSRVSPVTVGAYEYTGTVVPPPADTTAPTVSVTAPANGSTVTGSVALAATASDNVGVARVEFRANGVLVGTDTTAPYTGTWDASGATAGSHTIQARAIDAANNATNASVSVTVPAPADTTAPTVSVTAPANGSTVTGSVALAATASDNVGVARVEFRAERRARRHRHHRSLHRHLERLGRHGRIAHHPGPRDRRGQQRHQRIRERHRARSGRHHRSDGERHGTGQRLDGHRLGRSRGHRL